MKKKTKSTAKTIIGLTLGAVLISGVVIGSIKLSENWDNIFGEKPNEVNEKINHVVYDFTENTKGSSELSTTTALEFFDTFSSKEDTIIAGISSYVQDETTMYRLGKVYKDTTNDTGSLKFSSASVNGLLGLDFIEGYTYNHIKITGRNYGTPRTIDEVTTYSCDEGKLSINAQQPHSFTTNKSDTSIIAPIDTIQMAFNTNQFSLHLEATNRINIYTIELWLTE